ncbi:hypothetical protein B9Z55_018320 [Caenorhabditis nigoni]|uniref:Uncharacterized protein n=1 Tax=Caenorhabditis nigoni TaxID=1611254 RepID=A0A2G5TDP7_9PELO|nr:hypothetical protein B9Z55_018320 [Caenorhabditis nigoni]
MASRDKGRDYKRERIEGKNQFSPPPGEGSSDWSQEPGAWASGSSGAGALELWSSEAGALELELWSWSSGAGALELWSWSSGAGALELELWSWSSGAGALELELWSWSSGAGALELELWSWKSGALQEEPDQEQEEICVVHEVQDNGEKVKIPATPTMVKTTQTMMQTIYTGTHST